MGKKKRKLDTNREQKKELEKIITQQKTIVHEQSEEITRLQLELFDARYFRTKSEEKLKKYQEEQDKQVKEKEQNTSNEEFFDSYPKKLIRQCEQFVEKYNFNDFLREVSESIIGQEKLEVILTLIYNYIAGIAHNGRPAKINSLLVAPSGCGKTETYRVIKTLLASEIPILPVSHYDLTMVTTEGFKGKNTNWLLSDIISFGSNGYGICFFDEIDKRCSPQFTSKGEDVSNQVQTQLLTLLEGRKEYLSNGTEVDTSLTCIVGCGSFNSVRERKKISANERMIGFVEKERVEYDIYENITREDMLSAGCVYEFLGRFPVIINYHRLTEEAIKRIIHRSSKKISEELNLQLDISQEFEEYLLNLRNGDFGVRLLHSEIYSIAMIALTEVLKKGMNYPLVKLISKDEYEILCECEHEIE